MKKINLLNHKMNSNVVVYLLIILFVVLALVLLRGTGEKNKKNDEVPETGEMIGTVNFERLDNAKIKDGNKVNISSRIKREHLVFDMMTEEEIANIIMKDVTISSDGNIDVYFRGKLENRGKTTFQKCTFRVALYDRSGNYLYSFDYILQDNVPSGEEVEIEYLSPDDYINAYDYRVSVYT